ncbi:MAG: lipocalin family protein [Paludibacter sp.]|nr:lipocalin family protein [Paludibacter sp.]
MKRTLNCLIVLVITAMAMVSCLPDDDVFDETLLYGRWKSGTEYYRFDEAGTGKNWDTADSTEEDEGGNFTWTLVKSDLTIIRLQTMGGDGVPHVYTVIELTPTILKLNDGFDTKTYSKVN